MTKRLVAREPRQADYSVAKVVSTAQESAHVDEATFLYCKTLFDNPILLKTVSVFASNSVMFSQFIQLWVMKASR